MGIARDTLETQERELAEREAGVVQLIARLDEQISSAHAEQEHLAGQRQELLTLLDSLPED